MTRIMASTHAYLIKLSKDINNRIPLGNQIYKAFKCFLRARKIFF